VTVIIAILLLTSPLHLLAWMSLREMRKIEQDLRDRRKDGE
jgi:hypothetical protein